jgi:hypothetical protein
MTVPNTLRAGLAASLIVGAALFAAVPASASPGASGGAAATTSAAKHVPVFAYFYQWYNPSSWDRAKQDLPLVGKYSSDDPHVLRDQVEAARGAHIDGFLTSWKSTDALNRRLDLLIKIARSENLDLGVVYEALDFSRRPLPVATVLHDMLYLVSNWGADLKSTYYGRPLIIWTGIDQSRWQMCSRYGRLSAIAPICWRRSRWQTTNALPDRSTGRPTTGPPLTLTPRRR